MYSRSKSKGKEEEEKNKEEEKKEQEEEEEKKNEEGEKKNKNKEEKKEWEEEEEEEEKKNEEGEKKEKKNKNKEEKKEQEEKEEKEEKKKDEEKEKKKKKTKKKKKKKKKEEEEQEEKKDEEKEKKTKKKKKEEEKKKKKKKKKKKRRRMRRRKRRRLFSPGNELEFKDETIKVLPFEHSFFMVLKVGYFGKQVRNSWKVLKCGAGEGWRRVKYEVLHKFEGKRNIVYTVKRRKVNWIGHILRWNCLLKYVIEGKIEESIKAKGRRTRRHKQLVDIFLVSNTRRVLNVVCFLLGNSPALEFDMPTFRNTLFHLHKRVGTYPNIQQLVEALHETRKYRNLKKHQIALSGEPTL